ncbi:Protein MraZ [Verrucomicrobia bacterium]|nr:Protein MraZ [Verrucomicrobiota bacterium]
MEPNGTSEPTYNWRFEHGVDEKRRVQIPANWRPSEGSLEFTLVLWSKDREGPCVRVLPPKEVEKLHQDIGKLPPDKRGMMKRVIGSGSFKVQVDKSGRIILPEEMAQKAGITDKAVLVGLLDRFEIWSAERYQKKQDADEVAVREAMDMME